MSGDVVLHTVEGTTRRSTMYTSRTVLVTLAAIALAGCGGDAERSQAGAGITPGTTNPPPTSANATTSSTDAESTPSSDPATTHDYVATTATEGGEEWPEALAERCRRLETALGSTPWPASVAAFPDFAEKWRQIATTLPSPEGIPATARGEVGDLAATMDAVEGQLDQAVEAAAGGDVDAAYLALDRADDLLIQTAGMSVVAGVECLGLDPARAAGAALTAPVLVAWQIENAFGSSWVSRELADEVVRIDPETGEVLATVSVGSRPLKLQGADGRVWVRTNDAFEAIDPTTNTVAATLAKSDVGPAANRSWAVDGALWICDGTTLHRYDPTTVERTTSLDMEAECGQVHAADDVVTAWTYNEDEGESGRSTATFVDPSTNVVVATVELPVDVGVPVVLDDRVLLPGQFGSTMVSVDRSTWTVAARADLGRSTGGSQSAFDGAFVYVPTADKIDVLVVDPASLEVVDTIRPLEVNAVVAADGGGVWTASNTINFVQRFDRPS
jgi:hypothetical protein